MLVGMARATKKSPAQRRVWRRPGLNRNGVSELRCFPQPRRFRRVSGDKPVARRHNVHGARPGTTAELAPSMDGPADHDLMARAAKGDGRAFRTLAERHTGAALRLARRILGNGAMAEDVVQDALLRVWINAPRWRPEAAFRTWLYRIVVNLCLNAKRRAADLPLDAAEQVADAGPAAGRTASNSTSATGASPRPSARCPSVSAPPSCSPIRKGSAMRRSRRCSIPPCRASRHCWFAPGERCAPALGSDQE